jgi:LacI family transcriptional regulator
VEQQRPTLRDICRVADVSIFTASRALSGHDGVALETRERVHRIARELGYVANQVARNLKHSSSRTVGVLTANIENQYYALLVGALEKVVQERGFHCFVTDAVVDGAYSVERENQFIASLLEHRVAGVVVTYSLTQENMRRLSDWRLPILFVDCLPPPGYEHLPCITADNYAASREVGIHLAGHGYRVWGFVAHTPAWSTRRPREQGLRDEAAVHGARVEIIEGGNDGETAFRAVSAFLDGLPRRAWPAVLYASNTPLLHGTLRALRDRRLRIPEDIAIVAFDEFDWAALLTPPVTVVDQRIQEIGTAAGRRLLDLFAAAPEARGGAAPVVSQLKPFLRIRASCGCGAAKASRAAATPRSTLGNQTEESER